MAITYTTSDVFVRDTTSLTDNVYEVTLTGTYVAGGYELTASDFKIEILEFVRPQAVVDPATPTAYPTLWNVDTQLLQVFDPTSGDELSGDDLTGFTQTLEVLGR